MRIVVSLAHKSIPKGLEFEIPKFCVLTGKNGSGKSHLLEAMGNGHAHIFNGDVRLTKIHLVGFNGLNPQVDEQCDQNQITNSVNQCWNQITNYANRYREMATQGHVVTDFRTQLFAQFGSNPPIESAVLGILKATGKKIDKITQDDVFNNLSFIDLTQNQLFFSQCAMIFKAYHSRKIKNEFSQFRMEKYGAKDLIYYTPDQFFKKFGPPPWELINHILKRAGLSYEVSSPEVEDFDLPYRLRLIDRVSANEISVNDLSSGEKVLMSLALAIYNTQEGGTKPELLLLDEPDAPLHPQFSKLLIETLIETIVDKSGVSVILTTHSPSTVAMAPEGSVYEIDRTSKMLRVVSNADAVQILTEGISFLKVSYENRKQIFVESKYDVQYFQRLFSLLKRKNLFEHEPIFLEPHSGTSNCGDVISIVEKLRASGSDLAFGIIDFDMVNHSNGPISVLGNGARYAIENYLLDPLYVALALIRHSKKSFSDFGVMGKHVYTDAAHLTLPECQTIIDQFVRLIGLDASEPGEAVLANGFKLLYPKSFLLHQGHQYEQKINSAFNEIKAISKGNGDSALKLGILQVIEEFPQFLPIEIEMTFESILGKRNTEGIL